jgi:hypothetical protein
LNDAHGTTPGKERIIRKLGRPVNRFSCFDWLTVMAEILALVQCCSLNKISVRPELVEGLWLRSGWFDKLTTNG